MAQTSRRYIVVTEGTSPRTAKPIIAIDDRLVVAAVAREIAHRLGFQLDTASGGTMNPTWSELREIAEPRSVSSVTEPD
jgi:hypothetical protein